MKIVYLSKNQYENLLPLDIEKGVLNTEAKMFRYTTSRNEDKVVKSLFYIEGETFASKLYTIEMLDTYKEYLPESFVIPDSLLSVRDRIISFTLPYKEGINLSTILKNKNMSVKEQLYYLKKVGEILYQLKNIREYSDLKKIFINDLHDSNFIVNTKKKSIYVIDLDSCKIGNNICFTSRFLSPYSIASILPIKYKVNTDNNGPGYIIPDENTDTYCYMIMILNYLYGENINSMPFNLDILELTRKEINNMSYEEKMTTLFYEYLNYLEWVGYHIDLLDCFNNILNNANNVNPFNYLDSINDKMVYRARSNVYNSVRGNRLIH